MDEVDATASDGPHEPSTADIADRVLAASQGWADGMAIYLGDRLGWYRCLADTGPCTPDQLAERTRTSARYAREWLEHQAVTGMLAVENAGDPPLERRFALPAAAAEVLTDERSLSYLAPLPRMFAASGVQLPALLAAYRSGDGVSWADFGDDARQSQADMNRPWFDAMPGVLGAIPEVDAVLGRPGARIADVGSGGGWSSIALALAYPHLAVDGFDVDEPSVRAASDNAANAGVADRVRFRLADAAGLGDAGPFDAAFAFECIHDMPHPVDVLAGMRGAVRHGGPVIIMDEAVAPEFTAPGDDLERIMYAFSLFVCLPDGLSHQPSAATGTVMRPAMLRDYARAAGFADVTVLPTGEFGFWRFYSLIG